MSNDTAGPNLRRRRIEANGLTFECLHAGDGDRLALCLHGFPDNAGSMAPILWRLAEEGYTAVAPFIGGQGEYPEVVQKPLVSVITRIFDSRTTCPRG